MMGSRRRKSIAVFAIVFSILVSTMPAAAVTTENKVVSSNSSDTDFNTGTLTNMTVEGSGSSAYVQFYTHPTGSEEFFYNTSDVNQTFTAPTQVFKIKLEAWGAIGRGARFAAGGSGGQGGYGAGNLSVTPGSNLTIAIGEHAGGDYSNGQRDVPGTSPWHNGGAGGNGDSVNGGAGGGGTAVFRDSDGATLLIAGAGGGGGGGAGDDGGGGGGAPGGSGGGGINPGQDAEGTGAEGGDGGDAGGGNGENGDGSAHAALTDVTTDKGGGKSHSPPSRPDSNDGAVRVSWSGDDYPSGKYLNNHSVTYSTGGYVDMTATTNVTVTVTWRGDSTGDGSYDTLLNQTTGITTVANHSFSWNKFNGDDVRLNVSVERNSQYSNFTFQSEGVEALVTSTEPDNSSASPHDTTIATSSTTLSLDMSDVDFPTAQGDSVTVDIYLNDSLVDTQSGITSNQTITYTTGSLPDGTHTWNMTFTDSYGLNSASAEFNYTIEHYQPVFDNASMSPDDGEKFSTKTVNLTINVTDGDFPIDGDTVTVDFFVDDVNVGTDTLTSNGTARYEHTDVAGGTSEWFANASDTYGSGTVTSATETFTVPAALEVRNETNASQLITGAEVVLYATDGFPIENRTDAGDGSTDGSIDMTGLPVTDSFVAVVRHDDYWLRSIYFDDIFVQNDVFLYKKDPTNHSVINNTFIITDQSGNYPPATSVFKIQRALNQSDFTEDENTTAWVTIAGDRIGADESYLARLEENARYRLLVENQDGDQQILGEYTAQQEGSIPLLISQRTFDLTSQDEGYDYSANYTTDGSNAYVNFQLSDQDDGITNVDVVIHEHGNESNKIYNDTLAGPYGNLSITQPIPSGQENLGWVVDWEADHAEVEGGIGAEIAVGQQTISPGSQTTQWLKEVLSAGGVVALALLFGRFDARFGVLVVPVVAGGMWYLGWMAAEVGGGAIFLAILIGGGLFVGTARG